MSILEAELAGARAELAAKDLKMTELNSLFISNVTKLGEISTAFQVDSGLNVEDFRVAVKARRRQCTFKE